jgi:hypothetical protein
MAILAMLSVTFLGVALSVIMLGDVMLNVLKSNPILMSCSTLFSSHSGAMTISTMTPWIITLDAEYQVSGCCPECHYAG